MGNCQANESPKVVKVRKSNVYNRGQNTKRQPWGAIRSTQSRKRDDNKAAELPPKRLNVSDVEWQQSKQVGDAL